MSAHSFSVRLSELDSNGRLQPYHVISYFQDAASIDLQKLQMSGFELAKKDLGWVINAMTVVFEGEMPEWNEQVSVSTWALNRTGVRLFRDFTAESKTMSAKGTSSWVIIDEKSRRPVGLDLFGDRELILCEPALPGVKPGHFSPLSPGTEFETFSYTWNPRTSEQDLNAHINNINYLIACFESIPQKFRANKNLARVDIFFKAEIYAKQPIEIKTELTETEAFHRLVRTSDQTEVCVAKTQWRNR